jgi:alpha-beta hydrolase superfamily lysophospholipase
MVTWSGFVTEQVVTLRNRDGHAMHCILELPSPEKRRSELACLLLSPGVKMRVAPHRLYRKIAQEFLDQGIAVMRVDFHGLGDSEGELPEQQLDQLYRQVQLGRHVPDVLVALDWFAMHQGARRFIVGGLCGGALTGLLAAEADDRIVGVYALGIPAILDASGAHAADVMTQGQLTRIRSIYLRKMFDPASWRRLLTARSDYRTIFRALTVALGLRPRHRHKQEVFQVPQPTTPAAPNLNPHFVRAMFRLLAGGNPALLIFSGADRLQWEYEEKFARPWAEALLRYREHLEVPVIPSANHVLSEPAWVQETRRLTQRWLQTKFGGSR